MHQSSYQSNIVKSSSAPLELIYADVWGPSPVASFNGDQFFVNFVDDFSKYNWLFPISDKSSIRGIFVKFKLMIENQLGLRIKRLQTDNGGEFLALKSNLDDSSIIHRRSCPYVHQQMGVVERRHRHIVDNGIALLNQAQIPWSLWSYAFSTIVYLYNRTPTRILAGKSPFKTIFQKIPNLQNIRVFGSLAYPNLRPSQRSKFSPQSAPHVFLGSTTFNLSTKKITVANDVFFFERDFNFGQHLAIDDDARGQSDTVTSVLPILHSPHQASHEDVSSASSTSSAVNQHHLSSSLAAASSNLNNLPASTNSMPAEPPEIHVPARGHHMTTRAAAGIVKANPKYALLICESPRVPNGFSDAIKHPRWKDAMDMGKEFPVKDIGDLKFFLGVHVNTAPDGSVTFLASVSHEYATFSKYGELETGYDTDGAKDQLETVAF